MERKSLDIFGDNIGGRIEQSHGVQMLWDSQVFPDKTTKPSERDSDCVLLAVFIYKKYKYIYVSAFVNR